MEEKAKEEIERLKELLLNFDVPEKKIKMLHPVIEHTAWMKVKLDEARQIADKSSVVISYDNGGGQKGIRENPLFKGYEALWKSYMQGMTKIIDCIPDDNAQAKKDEIEKPLTMLEVVRARKKA